MDSSEKTKKRIPNKTQWALLDILDHCIGARETWQRLMDMAEERMDPAMMLYLSKNRDHWAEVERLASDALEGKYRETS